MQRQEILYLRGRREAQQPTQKNEKITPELLPPTWTVAFNIQTHTLTLLIEDVIAVQAHLALSEALIFYLLYLYYPHYAPDMVLWEKLQMKDPLSAFHDQSQAEKRLASPSSYKPTPKEKEQVIGRPVSRLRMKLQQIGLSIKRTLEAGYVLSRNEITVSSVDSSSL